MNTNKLKSSLVTATALMVLAAAPALAQSCSNASLQGSFGYTGEGKLTAQYVKRPDIGLFAEVGSESFDGSGNTTATATLSANGNIVSVTIDGTYKVNSDCTGTMVLNVSPLGATVHLNLVIDNAGKEMRAIVTDSGVVESRVYQSF